MAENSAIFAAISPGMDIDTATDSLVSIMKAFNIQAEDMRDVMSEINDVGNKFALSNVDVVNALIRSASSMSAANNTLEQTIALETAAIEVTRNADAVGNSMKTVSMRIRGMDEETEQLSDDLVGISGDIADLTKTAENAQGVRLFEVGDPDTYRSTYDILKDISKVWDDITDKQQAQLLEKLFGKRQADICLYVQKCA